jgi:hypothetical protein
MYTIQIRKNDSEKSGRRLLILNRETICKLEQHEMIAIRGGVVEYPSTTASVVPNTP